MSSWTLHRAGTDYVVEEGPGTRVAVLRIEGEVVDTQTADYWDKVTLTHGDTEFEAKWGH